MTTLNRTARLIAAIASVGLTVALFSGVVALAEPQRSTLMAKSAAEQPSARGKTKASVQVADAR
jgi:hypothetical protein